MSKVYICDGCGKVSEDRLPDNWKKANDSKGNERHICSLSCEQVASGKYTTTTDHWKKANLL